MPKILVLPYFKEIHDKYKLPPFAGNVVCFYGFDAAELEHMTEILVANGGRVAEGGEKGNSIGPLRLILDVLFRAIYSLQIVHVLYILAESII